jgi:hypothetical protein
MANDKNNKKKWTPHPSLVPAAIKKNNKKKISCKKNILNNIQNSIDDIYKNMEIKKG